jgi:hypothetical protein
MLNISVCQVVVEGRHRQASGGISVPSTMVRGYAFNEPVVYPENVGLERRR